MQTMNTLSQGIRLQKAGDFSSAEEIYLNLLKKNEGSTLKALFLLGLLAGQKKEPEEACRYLDAYLMKQPDDYHAFVLLGLAKFDLEDYLEAKDLFIKALKKDKTSASLYFNLGQTHMKLGEHLEACENFTKALSIDKNYALALVGKGLALKELFRLTEAADALTQAVLMDDQSAEAFFFLGNVMRDLCELENSITYYQKALSLQPKYIEAAINCGNSFKDLGHDTEALHYYDLALQLDNNHPEANYNKSLVLLNKAQFEAGWPLFEWRFKSQVANNKFIRYAPIDSLSTWDGSPLAGHLLVLPEQGIGDQIFFIGMLNDLRSNVEKLTVCADSRLLPLLSRSYPGIDFTDDVSSVDLSQFNAQIHIGGLGQYLRPNAKALSHVISPYLWANTDQANVLRNNLKKKDRLLCGISWLSKNADHGKAKSLRLSSLEYALQLPGFDFVDLQYGDTQGEREEILQAYGVNIIKNEEIDNFADIDGLASLISACDLVVTVSNTTAHLACALGKPTLVLLPQSSAVFWYWHQRDMHSPWYPTAVLLRQQEFGGWPQVMQVVCQILKGMQ